MASASEVRYVVGLGNPDRQYERTRHNVGFIVLDELRRRHDFGRARSKFHARCWTGRIRERGVVLLAPQTYMNRSGLAVSEMLAFYKAPPGDVLIVLDDMALPLGRTRARAEGSAGGHNGLGDIIQALGTDRVPRLRVGIGRPEAGGAVAHVLDEFDRAERPVIAAAIARAADAVEEWVARGVTFVMNRYNQDATGIGPSEDGKNE